MHSSVHFSQAISYAAKAPSRTLRTTSPWTRSLRRLGPMGYTSQTPTRRLCSSLESFLQARPRIRRHGLLPFNSVSHAVERCPVRCQVARAGVLGLFGTWQKHPTGSMHVYVESTRGTLCGLQSYRRLRLHDPSVGRAPSAGNLGSLRNTSQFPSEFPKSHIRASVWGTVYPASTASAWTS